MLNLASSFVQFVAQENVRVLAVAHTVSLEGLTFGSSPFQCWGRNGHTCTAKSLLFMHVQQTLIVRKRAAKS